MENDNIVVVMDGIKKKVSKICRENDINYIFIQRYKDTKMSVYRPGNDEMIKKMWSFFMTVVDKKRKKR